METAVGTTDANTTLLSNVWLFEGLSHDDLQAIEDKSNLQHFPKNSILVHEGQEADSMYVVVSGKLKVYVGDEDGKELTLGTLSAGDCFGELALIDDAPRSATVEAQEKTTVLKMRDAEFQGHLRAHPQVTMNLLRYMARRVRGVNDHIRDLALLDVYGRVARTLLRLTRDEDGVLITDPVTQQEIANMVGASREMVSRVMNNLKQDGYITVAEKRVTVLADPPTRRAE